MKIYQLLLIAAIVALSCKKDDADSTKIVITGQFQKIVEGTNIWVETIDGVTAEEERYVMFVPENIENTLEEMYATPDANGKFQVRLNKGESYHVLINYKSRGSAEGVIKFNESLYNQIIVPADAPNNADLGTVYITAWYPYGMGGINIYLAEKPLPWQDTINLYVNNTPVINDVLTSLLPMNDPSDEYGYQRITYTADVSDADDDMVYYNWILSTPDNSASFLAWNTVIRTVGSEAWVYTKSASSHGTLTLIVTDERGGSAKREISF